MGIKLDDVKMNPEVRILLEIGQNQLDALDFTEHSFRHADIVSSLAGYIMNKIGGSHRETELAEIAGYLHDIGNSVNRNNHPSSGAILAYRILRDMGMDAGEAAEIMVAIGNHDEQTGAVVSRISAALIMADKSDVHRTRVRNTDFATFDIHDRVNYAVKESQIKVDKDKKIITLHLTIDTSICSLMEYFEIFLTRMMLNRRAAAFLGFTFELIANKTKLL